jgi:hypothetical protein
MKRMELNKAGLLALLAGSLLLSGCTAIYTDPGKPPLPTLKAGDASVEPKLGKYCWYIQGVGKCTEDADAPELLKGAKPSTVPAGSQLTIGWGNEKPEAITRVDVWKGSTAVEVPLQNNAIQLPKEKGTYVYDIVTRFQEGDATYAFTVDVQ